MRVPSSSRPGYLAVEGGDRTSHNEGEVPPSRSHQSSVADGGAASEPMPLSHSPSLSNAHASEGEEGEHHSKNAVEDKSCCTSSSKTTTEGVERKNNRLKDSTGSGGLTHPRSSTAGSEETKALSPHGALGWWQPSREVVSRVAARLLSTDFASSSANSQRLKSGGNGATTPPAKATGDAGVSAGPGSPFTVDIPSVIIRQFRAAQQFLETSRRLPHTTLHSRAATDTAVDAGGKHEESSGVGEVHPTTPPSGWFSPHSSSRLIPRQHYISVDGDESFILVATPDVGANRARGRRSHHEENTSKAGSNTAQTALKAGPPRAVAAAAVSVLSLRDAAICPSLVKVGKKTVAAVASELMQRQHAERLACKYFHKLWRVVARTRSVEWAFRRSPRDASLLGTSSSIGPPRHSFQSSDFQNFSMGSSPHRPLSVRATTAEAGADHPLPSAAAGAGRGDSLGGGSQDQLSEEGSRVWQSPLGTHLPMAGSWMTATSLNMRSPNASAIFSHDATGSHSVLTSGEKVKRNEQRRRPLPQWSHPDTKGSKQSQMHTPVTSGGCDGSGAVTNPVPGKAAFTVTPVFTPQSQLRREKLSPQLSPRSLEHQQPAPQTGLQLSPSACNLPQRLQRRRRGNEREPATLADKVIERIAKIDTPNTLHARSISDPNSLLQSLRGRSSTCSTPRASPPSPRSQQQQRIVVDTASSGQHPSASGCGVASKGGSSQLNHDGDDGSYYRYTHDTGSDLDDAQGHEEVKHDWWEQWQSDYLFIITAEVAHRILLHRREHKRRECLSTLLSDTMDMWIMAALRPTWHDRASEEIAKAMSATLPAYDTDESEEQKAKAIAEEDAEDAAALLQMSRSYDSSENSRFLGADEGKEESNNGKSERGAPFDCAGAHRRFTQLSEDTRDSENSVTENAARPTFSNEADAYRHGNDQAAKQNARDTFKSDRTAVYHALEEERPPSAAGGCGGRLSRPSSPQSWGDADGGTAAATTSSPPPPPPPMVGNVPLTRASLQALTAAAVAGRGKDEALSSSHLFIPSRLHPRP